MKITVIGTGYVGLSIATLLSTNNEVIALDIVKEKVDKINSRIPTISDREIEFFFSKKNLNLRATLDEESAFKNADYIVIATPTDYDENTNYFNTKSVESCIEKITFFNPKATIIIKSTVPVGFTENAKKKYKNSNIIFSPEFLREGKALYDNLFPSRIILGENSIRAKVFAELLRNASNSLDTPILYTNNTEAEAIKLFANTFLALRISYFNELDSYALTHGLDSRKVIEGVCLDPRIGNHYNNPSFGYGGYCLPKDTKQLLANYKDIPQSLISAVVESNSLRKKFIANEILKLKPEVVGVYRLIMKKDSDNFRSSSIQDIIKILRKHDIKILIYEPNLKTEAFEEFQIENDFEVFSKKSDLILSNRKDEKLINFSEKVFTRDIFQQD